MYFYFVFVFIFETSRRVYGLIELLLLFHEHVVSVRRKMRQSDDGSVRYTASPDHPNSPLQPGQNFVFVFVFVYLFSKLLLNNHT